MTPKSDRDWYAGQPMQWWLVIALFYSPGPDADTVASFYRGLPTASARYDRGEFYARLRLFVEVPATWTKEDVLRTVTGPGTCERSAWRVTPEAAQANE
jgi:hypothetical protein